jgi:hypothetical protein
MKQINEKVNDKKIKKTSRLFLLAALSIFAGACVVNMEDGEKPAPVAGDEGRLVTLLLAVPGLPASRGLDEPGENFIETVDVLLFKDDKFYYRAIGSNIDDDGGITKKKFNVRLPMGTYGIVVLANARAALAGFAPATVSTANIPRSTFLDSLAQVVQPYAGPNEKWTDKFSYIPMWGYYKDGASTTLTINEGATTLQPINLTRAIARVDVSVALAAQGDFSLESVYLYNYSRAGSLAPAVYHDPGPGTNVDGYDGNQWNILSIPAPEGLKAVAPHLPAYAVKIEGPLEYIVNDDPDDPEFVYKQEIYTYEAAVGTPGTMMNTCLVIGGYYDGSDTPTYYRVEFANKVSEPDQYQYLPLLRNYKYNVEIQEVNGHGYPRPGDAYANKPANIVVNIVPWDEGGMNDVEFNGQHYLAVDKSELVFYRSGAAKSLEAITDYPGGWTVTTGVPEFPAWLHVSEPTPKNNVSTGELDKRTTLKLTAGSWNSGTRAGFFYIVAGNLKKKITVRQVDEEEFSLELSPWELTFYKTVGGAKTVTLIPVPAASPSYTLGVTGNIAWESGYNPGTDAMNILGGNILTLLPAANGGGTTLGSSVLVTLAGSGGKSVTRVVNVRQLAREPLFTAFPSNPYPAGAGDYKFSILSELPWQVTSSTELWLTADDHATREGSPAATREYTFHLEEFSGSGYGTGTREALVNVASDDPDFLATTVPIVQTRGPYLVITDPASKEHRFGDPATPRAVTFKTNAGWFFTGDASFGDVISGVTLGETSIVAGLPAQTGSTRPDVEVFETLTFTPSDMAAGLKHATVTFTTANHGDVPEASDVMTFSRFVPAAWDFENAKEGSTPLENGSSILANATSVTLAASANLHWWGRVGDDGDKVSTTGEVTGYQSKSVNVSFTARSTTEFASWNSDENVTVQAGYDTWEGITGETTKELSLKRPPYTLKVTGHSKLKPYSVTLAIETNAPEFSIELKDGDELVGSCTGTTSGNHVIPLTGTDVLLALTLKGRYS